MFKFRFNYWVSSGVHECRKAARRWYHIHMYNTKLYHYLLQTRALRVRTACTLPCVLTWHEGQNISYKNTIQASNKSKYEDQSPAGETRTGCCVLLYYFTKVTAPLAAIILLQQHEITTCEQQCAKAEVRRLKQQ